MECCTEIDSLEDPLTQAPMPKSQFYAIYRPLLDTLDGSGGYPDAFISYFFERCSARSAARKIETENCAIHKY